MSTRPGPSPRPFAELLLARFGVGWVGAIVFAIAALAVYEVALQPARIALAGAQQRLAQSLPPTRPSAPAAAVRNEAQQLRDLRAILPAASEATRQIAALDALARAQQIAVTQADYVRRAHTDMAVVQLQVTQPIKGTYPQVKRYVEAVLRAMPNVSLDQIAARRDNVSQPQLEVRLRWSVWMQGSEPSRSAP